MGVRILVSGGEKCLACLYDSVTMSAFGPVMTLEEGSPDDLQVLALGFIEFVENEKEEDPRRLSDGELHKLYASYLRKLADEADEKSASNKDKLEEGGAA